MEHYLLLIGAGVLGGFINAMAGGGGIIMYPALLASGLSPLIANATASLVVVPGSLASTFGYRKELRKVPKGYLWLIVPAFFGAIIGSVILTTTDPHTFEKLAPWLILSAVLLLATQSQIHRFVTKQSKKRKIHWHTMPLIYAAVFPLAIYAGFFGPGFGLMMLAILGFSTLKNIHQMNAVKNFCSVVMAFVCTLYFLNKGLIDLESGLIMGIGTATGGILGAKFAHKISTHLVHDLTVAIGLIIVFVLLIK